MTNMEYNFSSPVVMHLSHPVNNKILGFKISIWGTQIIYSKSSLEDKIHSRASSKTMMIFLVVEVVGSNNFNKAVFKEVSVEAEVMYSAKAALEEWVEVNQSVARQSLKMEDKKQLLKKQGLTIMEILSLKLPRSIKIHIQDR